MRLRRPFSTLFAPTVVGLVFAAGAFAQGTATDPMDWPFWRGPEQNGTSREVGLVDRWSPSGENLLWKREDLGGRSTPVVLHGKLATIVRHNPGTPIETEKVVCVDAATGKTLWENIFNVFLSDVPAERVGWSSAVWDPQTGNVYALGVAGLFQCIDGETGKTIWSHSLSEEFGLLSTYGGRTNFPVVFEDLVVINAVMIGWGDSAKPNHRYLGFDKKAGKLVWSTKTRDLPDDTTYSTPIIANIHGQALLIAGSGDGFLHAMQPRTGKIVWKYNLSRRGANATPLIVGDTVYTSQSEENPNESSMGALCAIDGSGVGDVTQSLTKWKNKEWMIGRAAPLLIDDKLYAIDDGGRLFVADPKTGKEISSEMKLGTIQRASPLYADGKIYTCDMNGRWSILRPTEKGAKVIHKMRIPGEVHASPIVSHGRIYVESLDCLYCIGKQGETPKATPIPPAPAEDPVGDNVDPAVVQIVPAEALVHPGEKITFETRVYNNRGRLLDSQKAGSVAYTTTKGGEVDANGVFTASAEHAHHAAMVTAKLGALTSESRIRIVPDLPWNFDFNKGEIPVTWIGMRYRHVLRSIDGKKVMVKITTIPKGQRSQGWMGWPDLHDYTIQADVKGAGKPGRMPDIGLIAQRYTFDMMGNSQQLQIRSWTATLRAAKNAPFAWKPGVWYTLKFSAANEGDKAVLRGKAWERDKPEPTEWMITAEDDSPNKTGSPGFFGNAQTSELFLDNVKVYKNAAAQNVTSQ